MEETHKNPSAASNFAIISRIYFDLICLISIKGLLVIEKDYRIGSMLYFEAKSLKTKTVKSKAGNSKDIKTLAMVRKL